jgi:hypothetical protein
MEKGALAVIVRSLTHLRDEHPHTGAMKVESGKTSIPGVAISTRHADMLSEMLRKKEVKSLSLRLDCKFEGEALSYNVIGEIFGSDLKEEVIAVGGHLDSWDKGEGAHDDGAGCTHSIESIRLLKASGYKSKRTLRAILFMNEENGLKGAKTYAEKANKNDKKHFAAIESDRGGFTPRGFTFDTEQSNFLQAVPQFKAILSMFGLHDLVAGGSGADVGQLNKKESILLGFMPDSQRYFDYHHANTDVFEAVNLRELALGSASIAAMVYLLDAKL